MSAGTLLVLAAGALGVGYVATQKKYAKPTGVASNQAKADQSGAEGGEGAPRGGVGDLPERVHIQPMQGSPIPGPAGADPVPPPDGYATWQEYEAASAGYRAPSEPSRLDQVANVIEDAFGGWAAWNWGTSLTGTSVGFGSLWPTVSKSITDLRDFLPGGHGRRES